MHAYQILVVEDEPAIGAAIYAALKREGWTAQLCVSAEGAVHALTSQAWDLAIVDVMLPGLSGFELVQLVRQQGIRVGIMMVTARDSLDDRVTGLRRGADDYLVKPFAMQELLARCEALLRRSSSAQSTGNALLHLGTLVVDRLLRTAHAGINGSKVDLADREFDLLVLLLQYAPRAVPRATIAREVWKLQQRATPIDNLIDVHIGRLRRKLAEAGAPCLIHTARGVGFCAALQAP